MAQNKEKENIDINKEVEETKDDKVKGQDQAQEQEPKEEQTKQNELEDKLAQANDKYIRLAAEFDNYRRRVSKEKLDLLSTASEDVLKGLLPVLDDCQRALDVLSAAKADESVIEGTSLILNKLFSYLKSKGLSTIDAIGKDLDTDFHEAVAQFPVEDEQKKNKIIDVVQQGYTLNGKVIRFTKVVVGI